MKKFVVSLVLAVLVGLGFTAEAQREHKPVTGNPIGTPVKRMVRNDQFKSDLLKSVDTMIRVYGQADMSDLYGYAKNNVWAGPNVVIPWIALGHAYLNRYEFAGMDRDNLTKSLEQFEIVVSDDIYPSWGVRWASMPHFAHVLKAIHRFRNISANLDDFSLQARIATLESRCEQLGEGEGDRVLNGVFPPRPYVSGLTDGDSKGEEIMWEADGLAWLAKTFPNHPRAALWAAKAKELAFYALVRRSEGVTLNGEPFSTIEDDGTIMNHWILGDPHYQGGTPALAQMGALAYRIVGEEVPAEFQHNVALMYAKYKQLCAKDNDGRFIWTIASDPVGDPTVFPLLGLGDDAFAKEVAHQKAGDGYLWIPTSPVTGKLVVDPEKGITPGSSLGAAIQNGKTAMYYMDSFLWQYPPTAPATAPHPTSR